MSTTEAGSPALAVITFNAVPAINTTFKYDRLGPLALENRRQYCTRHGYTFVRDVSLPNDRPCCWAKIPAVLRALETHPWVVWADSDTLIFNAARRLEDFCDPAFDIIVQSQDAFFRHVGIEVTHGRARMPINTGVFLVQATDRARHFLQTSYEQTQFISGGGIWDGIGEQEAMTEVLRQHPEYLRRVGYVEHLQSHPKLYQAGDTFVHFYGNHARHRLSRAICEAVLQRWERAVAQASPLPGDLARFHWCCIQNLDLESPVVWGDVGRYLYSPEDIGDEA